MDRTTCSLLLGICLLWAACEVTSGTTGNPPSHDLVGCHVAPYYCKSKGAHWCLAVVPDNGYYRCVVDDYCPITVEEPINSKIETMAGTHW